MTDFSEMDGDSAVALNQNRSDAVNEGLLAVIEKAISDIVCSRNDLGHTHFVVIRDAVLAALRAVPSTDTAGVRERWHLGSMNDGLFIINTEPRPSNDYPWHDRPNGPTLVLNVTELPEGKAMAIVEAHNSALFPSHCTAGRREEIARKLCELDGYTWNLISDKPYYFTRADAIFALTSEQSGPTAGREVKLTFSNEELSALRELSEYHQISEMQTLRQSLRAYQLNDRRIREGETQTWSGDASRAKDFYNPDVPLTPSPPDRQQDHDETSGLFKCNCPHETRAGCAKPKCPHYVKPRVSPSAEPVAWLEPVMPTFGGSLVERFYKGPTKPKGWTKFAFPLYASPPVSDASRLRTLAAMFSESAHETWTKEEIVNIIGDAIRIGTTNSFDKTGDDK